MIYNINLVTEGCRYSLMLWSFWSLCHHQDNIDFRSKTARHSSERILKDIWKKWQWKTKSRIENWRITSGLPDFILFSSFIVLPVYTLCHYSTETEKEKAGLQAEVKRENQKKLNQWMLRQEDIKRGMQQTGTLWWSIMAERNPSSDRI